MSKKLNVVFLALALVVGLTLPSMTLAQDEAPAYVGVNLVQVKPHMMERFLDLHRDVFMPAGKKSGLTGRATLETVFGKSFEVAVAIPFTSFAELDQSRGGLTETEQALAGEAWQHTVDSRRAFVVQLRQDLSMEPAPAASLSRRARILVKLDKTQAFEELWKSEVLPAFEKSGHKGYQVYQTIVGGNNSEYWGVMPLPNFAAFDDFNLFGGLGEEAAAELNAKLTALAYTVEITVARLIPDLSYGLPGLEEATTSEE